MAARLKIIIYTIATGALLTGLWYFYAGTFKPTLSTSDTLTDTLPNTPVLPPAPPATSVINPDENITIGTSQGNVTIKNFYKNIRGAEGPAVVLQTNENYEITYDTQTSVFLLTIFRGPVIETKMALESDFIKTLNITQEEACRLSVFLTIPNSVDKNLAGNNYGLSFCPGQV